MHYGEGHMATLFDNVQISLRIKPEQGPGFQAVWQ